MWLKFYSQFTKFCILGFRFQVVFNNEFENIGVIRPLKLLNKLYSFASSVMSFNKVFWVPTKGIYGFFLGGEIYFWELFVVALKLHSFPIALYIEFRFCKLAKLYIS